MAYIPQIKPNFQCKMPGYFADVENECKVRVLESWKVNKMQIHKNIFDCKPLKF